MNVLCERAFSGHQAGSSVWFLGQSSAEILRRASESPRDLEWGCPCQLYVALLGSGRMRSREEIRHQLSLGKADFFRRGEFQKHFFLSIFNPGDLPYQAWKFRKGGTSFFNRVTLPPAGSNTEFAVL